MGRNSLMKAADRQDIELLKIIISKIDINTPIDKSGKTALHWAVRGRYGGLDEEQDSSRPESATQFAQALLDHGANPNIANKQGTGVTALGVACSSGGFQFIDMLIKGGAEINHQGKIRKNTPLHFLTYKGNRRTLIELLKHKPDTSIQSNTGLTPLMEVFTRDNHLLLSAIFYDPEVTALIGGDPCLKVGDHNLL
mmetsp:Transcript_29553/g.45039  ORF Transcript_29553/g.45039 Transcript_29553/m.45039 type:complete len:196 (+) Transcript_29553:1388-1975(+)